MANLSTTYLGLELKNPIIVGSSRMTNSVDGVVQCAEAGAGAVILKSLFEEQIRVDYEETTEALKGDIHPEALAYLNADLATRYGPRQYLELVEKSAAAVSIPVIASVNCTSTHTWIEFAKQLEAAGASAVELNIYVMVTDPDTRSEEVERVYLDIVGLVADRISIPIAVKLAPYFTNLPRIASKLVDRGARGLVLFNKLYHPDIDLSSQEVAGRISLSHEDEYRMTLRWIALLAGQFQVDLCATRGLHDGRSVVKQVLAGAQAVQVVSAFFKQKLDHLQTMLDEVTAWMDEQGYDDLDAFRGKLSRAEQDAGLYERAQYIKAYVGIE
ncbi:MAG: dihydroorotate dehydrogenase-like protein [bacterium]